MDKHVKIPTAPNCIYGREAIHRCLIHLSLNEHYAETGLEYLHHAPSADAFLYRLKMLDPDEAYSMMVDANNALIEAIASKGILKKRAIVAIDYTTVPYYGRYNSMVYRSQHKQGTNMFYCYATISIVENGRRICLHALPVTQLDQKHEVLMRLIEYARKIVRIRLLLVDRAFFTIDCINTLDSMNVRYIMPGVKNSKVKEAIASNGPGSINGFEPGKKDRMARTRLAICRVRRKVKGRVRERRTPVFATNLKGSSKKKQLLKLIPKEYRRRWGIETSYSKIKESKAMTRSTSNTVRVLYFMTAVIVYNAWQLANLIIAVAIGMQLTGPIISMPRLARNITQFIEGG
jgi:putative transposase